MVGLIRELPQNGLNSGSGIIINWPDGWVYVAIFLEEGGSGDIPLVYCLAGIKDMTYGFSLMDPSILFGLSVGAKSYLLRRYAWYYRILWGLKDHRCLGNPKNIATSHNPGP